MVDHLTSSGSPYWHEHRTPLLELGNKPEIMELNLDMSCMNISDANSQSNKDALSYISSESNVDDKSIINTQPENKTNQKRSLRKRIRPIDYSKEKIEIMPKVQKLNKGPITPADIERYYLCKNTKRLHLALETIYEEPTKACNKSKKKLKRCIQFDQDSMLSSKLKMKRRLTRAKQLPSSTNFLNRKKVTMESLLKKLSNLESDNE